MRGQRTRGRSGNKLMTHPGDGLGSPASGKNVSMEGQTMVDIKDGRIDEGWSHMECGGLLAKLHPHQL